MKTVATVQKVLKVVSSAKATYQKTLTMAKNIKCVAVGDGAVGKTSMLMAYTMGSYPEDYLPTIFDNYAASMLVDQQVLTISFWDTAGQEEYDQLRPLTYPQTDVFLLCFSVASPASLNNAKHKWVPELRHYAPDTPIWLVGTKTDLRDSGELARKGLAAIFPQQGKEAAISLGLNGYLECSAARLFGLTELFETAIRSALIPPQLPPAKSHHFHPKCVIL